MVGLSSRFPSAVEHSAAAHGALPGASLFWCNQVVGRDLAATVPYHRWDVDAAYAPNGGAGKAYDCLYKRFVLLHAQGLQHAMFWGNMSTDVSRCRYVRCGTWLEGLEDFDQDMFGLAPGDAVALDPQARILLEQVQVGHTCHPCSCVRHVGVVIALHHDWCGAGGCRSTWAIAAAPQI